MRWTIRGVLLLFHRMLLMLNILFVFVDNLSLIHHQKVNCYFCIISQYVNVSCHKNYSVNF